VIPAYRERVRFVFLEDAAMPEILAAVRKLPVDSLVFYSFFFRDKAGSVLYVGKAKSLRPRVRSYFQQSQDTRTAIQQLPEFHSWLHCSQMQSRAVVVTVWIIGFCLSWSGPGRTLQDG
jgi:hypothetical protein